MLAVISAALAMGETRAAQAGCTKDVECKGVRICEDGRCVYPPPATEAAAPALPPTRTTAASSAVAAPVPRAAAVATPASAAPPEADAPAASSASVTAPSSPASAATAAEVPRADKGEVLDPSRVAPTASSVWRSRRPFPLEMGLFGFGIHDGEAGTFGGGLEAGYRFLRRLAVGAWVEASGERKRATVDWSYTHRLYSLGLGLTVRETAGRLLVDLSVFPELTRLTAEGAYLVSGSSQTRWGGGAGTRFRLGLPLGPWCPFIFVGGSFVWWTESLSVYEQHVYSGNVALPSRNASLGVGLAYRFGEARSNEAIRWTSPRSGE